MNEIEKLKQDIEMLKAWKAQKESQQLSYPLDVQSIAVLNEHFLSVRDSLIYTNPSGMDFTSWIVQQGAYRGVVGVGYPIYPYTVNTGTDVLTVSPDIVNGIPADFSDGTQVLVSFRQGGTMPSPLVPNVIYYVVNSTGNTFQLENTPGGGVINITSSGTGDQYIEAVN